MATTFELIGSASVGSGGAAFMEFTSIPSTFTDLCIYVSGRSARTGTLNDNLNITFNGSTSGYSGRVLAGDGSSAYSYVPATTYILSEIPTAAATANTFGNVQIYIPNYTASANKSVSLDSVNESNSSLGVSMTLIAGLWSNTAAITSVKIASQVNNFVQHSTAYLYGVKNV